jgi:hypothetical protein
MSANPPDTSLSARLASLTRRLGRNARAQRQLLERAAALKLPFSELPAAEETIWWQCGPFLQRLPELAHGALSGPVQEDKAAARNALRGLVSIDLKMLDNLDLRQIEGFCGSDTTLPACASFADYLQALPERRVRIISQKDFIKAISRPLPGFLGGEPIALLQASWRGPHLFWNDDQDAEAFASAICYARLRQIEVTLPAEITCYRLNPDGLQQLQGSYHMLAMPAESWSFPDFISLLLDNHIPYARLSQPRDRQVKEILLLPKDNPAASTLGEGLLLAGAANILDHLQQLLQTQD